MTETSYHCIACMPAFLSTYVSLHELGEVGVPNVVDMGPLEQSHPPLIRLSQQSRVKNIHNCTVYINFTRRSVHLESFFKVVVLFQEHGKVDDDLRSGYLQVNDPVVHRLGRLHTNNVHTIFEYCIIYAHRESI